MKSSRRLRRFFSSQLLPDPSQKTGKIHLSVEESHHLRNILRLDVGDRCLVTDGSGREVEAEVQSFSRSGEAQLKTVDATPASSTTPFFLRGEVALLQRGKMDFLVEKAQELGVNELWPMETDRTQLKMSQEKKDQVVERWGRIAREASKQSGSLNLLRIALPTILTKILERMSTEDEIAVFHPTEDAFEFKDWLEKLRLRENQPKVRVLNLFFGPEGGFSENEIRLFKKIRENKPNKVKMVRLGKDILKADTAFLSVTGALRLVLS